MKKYYNLFIYSVLIVSLQLRCFCEPDDDLPPKEYVPKSKYNKDNLNEIDLQSKFLSCNDENFRLRTEIASLKTSKNFEEKIQSLKDDELESIKIELNNTKEELKRKSEINDSQKQKLRNLELSVIKSTLEKLKIFSDGFTLKYQQYAPNGISIDDNGSQYELYFFDKKNESNIKSFIDYNTYVKDKSIAYDNSNVFPNTFCFLDECRAIDFKIDGVCDIFYIRKNIDKDLLFRKSTNIGKDKINKIFAEIFKFFESNQDLERPVGIVDIAIDSNDKILIDYFAKPADNSTLNSNSIFMDVYSRSIDAKIAYPDCIDAFYNMFETYAPTLFASEKQQHKKLYDDFMPDQFSKDINQYVEKFDSLKWFVKKYGWTK